MDRKDRRPENLDFKDARAEVLHLTDRMNVEIERYNTAAADLANEPTIGNLDTVLEKARSVLEIAKEINGMVKAFKLCMMLDAFIAGGDNHDP